MILSRTDFKVPFYAVIFSSIRATENLDGYAQMDEDTLREVATMPGFLGYESTGTGNRSIFISYWADMPSIENWRKNSLHLRAKSMGQTWYTAYHSQICKVEHHHVFGEF